MRWGFRVLTMWNGLGDIRNGKPGIFINPKPIMGIIIGVQCWDGFDRLLQFYFSLSSYHSHLLYFVSTSLFTLTLYVNTLYPSFTTPTTNYSSSISVHGRPPPFMSPCFVSRMWYLHKKAMINSSPISMLIHNYEL